MHHRDALIIASTCITLMTIGYIISLALIHTLAHFARC